MYVTETLNFVLMLADLLFIYGSLISITSMRELDLHNLHVIGVICIAANQVKNLCFHGQQDWLGNTSNTISLEMMFESFLYNLMAF